MIPTGLLPGYLSEAFGELYAEDGLLVMGKGLGILSLLGAFVRFYSDVEEGYMSELRSNSANDGGNAWHDTKRAPLVFVLGLRETDQDTLLSLLQAWGTPPDQLPTFVTNETGQAKSREGETPKEHGVLHLFHPS